MKTEQRIKAFEHADPAVGTLYKKVKIIYDDSVYTSLDQAIQALETWRINRAAQQAKFNADPTPENKKAFMEWNEANPHPNVQEEHVEQTSVPKPESAMSKIFKFFNS